MRVGMFLNYAGGFREVADEVAELERAGVDLVAVPEAYSFDANGGETWRVLDGSFSPGVAVGVTVEPEGGSAQPTTDPIVVIAT